MRGNLRAGLTVHENNAEAVIASVSGLLIASWAGRVTAAQIARIDDVIAELVGPDRARTYCSITLIEPNISMRLDERARARSAELQTRWAGSMRAQAYLVEGTGFLPATVRMVTSGLHLVTRSQHPLKMFSDPLELAQWIAPIAELEASDVLAAIGQVRAAGS